MLSMIPLLLLFFAQSSAFYNPFTIHRRSTTSTNLMMTSLAKLQKVKERSLERYDLGEPTEDESLLQNYEDIDGLDDEQNKPPVVGDVVTGIIIEMDENGALVEIGGKMSGFIPVKEISLEPVRNIESIYEIGQEVTGEVVGTLKGMPVISMRPTQLIAAWDKAISIRAAGETFETVVTGLNKGGAVCFAFGLDCFLPGSHYIGVLSENIVGQKLKVKFLDLVEEEGKAVVSQKLAMYEGRESVKRGDVMNATVTGLRPYGAFVELEGGLAGLLHISQISSDRIDNVDSIFTVGQPIVVMVIDHDKANGRVALSTRTLEANPGDMIRNMPNVFANAVENAKRFHEKKEAERLAREAAAKDIVAGLGGALDESGADPLLSVTESIESILASIVSESPSGVSTENKSSA